MGSGRTVQSRTRRYSKPFQINYLKIVQSPNGEKQMKQTAILAAVILVTGLVCQAGAESQDDVLLSALEDEMERSLEKLQLENEPKPYFVAYSVTEVSSSTATATLGGQLSSNSNRNRMLSVVVRVGSPELDNTNFSSMSGSFDLGGILGGGPQFPLTDNYDEIRRVAWLATDSAYKSAVSNLSGKKAALEQQNIEDRPSDFSEEETFTYSSSDHFPAEDQELLADIAKQLSAVLKGNADIQNSKTTVSSVLSRRIYMDSQGNQHDLGLGVCSATTQARTQTTEGIPIRRASQAYARNCSELAQQELRGAVKEMAKNLVAMMSAETLDSYTGPVLFEHQAAAQLVAQALSGRLADIPKPISDATGFNPFSAMENPFQNRIDSRVFPRSMSVINDPTIKEFNGKALLGSYDVDSEGMPSRRTEIISNGILKALLTTRAPTKSSDSTTGSNRGIGGPAPGNLFIESDDGVSADELLSELMMLAEENGQEYALIVRRIMDFGELDFSDMDTMMQMAQGLMGGNVEILPTVETLKVYPDGTEVPVLPVSITEFVDAHYRDIVASSEERQHIDIALSPGGNMMGMLGGMLGGGGMGGLATMQQSFISVVTPALLFEDLTLRSATGSKLRPPLIAHPLSE